MNELGLVFTLYFVYYNDGGWGVGGGGDRGGGREAEGDFVLSTMAPFLTLVCFQ